MKTCKQCMYATTQKVWHLFPVAYCGHPASAHPVNGAPTIPCATAREGHSCESCRPAHCGIDARLWRAPDAPQRPRWAPVAEGIRLKLPETQTKPGGFVPNTSGHWGDQFQAEHDAKASTVWIQNLARAVHGVKR